MYSKIKIFGHPLHPMLIPFPVAFYTGALVCYIVYSSNHDAFWFKIGYVANLAGIIMAALAALPGFIDWLNIPSDSKAKKNGFLHLAANVTALFLYTMCFLEVKDKWDDVSPAVGNTVGLTATGFILTLIAGFLGWTLVQKDHVGVDEITEDEKEIGLRVNTNADSYSKQ